MSIDQEILKTERGAPWREALRSATKNKDRIAIDRVHMPELAPHVRVKFQNREVNMGLCHETARREATRCMDCVNPTCIEGCPVSINIPKFIK